MCEHISVPCVDTGRCYMQYCMCCPAAARHGYIAAWLRSLAVPVAAPPLLDSVTSTQEQPV